jgi:hypothetical protein
MALPIESSHNRFSRRSAKLRTVRERAATTIKARQSRDPVLDMGEVLNE